MERTFSVTWSLRALLALALLAPLARAQSTAFTYQGQLQSGGAPSQGLHDFRFKLFDAPTGGTQQGATQCVDNVLVTDGVFTTTVDVGAQFTTTGQRFIEIDVRPDTGLDCSNATGFVTLSPRQLLTATPLATHARAAFSLDSPDGTHPNSVVVAAGGRVGVNTAAPAAGLDVRSDASFGTSGGFKIAQDGRVTMGNIGNLSQITIAAQDAIDVRAFQPFITLSDTTNGSLTVSARIQNVGGGLSFQSSNFLAGITNEFMYMDAAGRLGINTQSNGPTLDVAGTIRCTTLTQTSSAAFKDDVAPLASGLSELMRLRPVSYVWNDKAPAISRGKHDLGFIAEEVEKVLPDAVAKDDSGATIGIDYSRITVLAVKAIKDQQSRLDADREEIRSLRDRLAKLEAAASKKP